MNIAYLVLLVAIVIAIILLAMTIVIGVFHATKKSKQTEKQIHKNLTKLIEQAGGTVIGITPILPQANTLTLVDVVPLRYIVNYTDKYGDVQERHIIQHLDVGGLGTQLHGDTMWNKSLDVVQAELPSSKEQLISEMAAEIKRLQNALAVADTGDSLKSKAIGKK